MPHERIRDDGEIGYTFDDIIAAGLDESFPLSMDSAKKDLEKNSLFHKKVLKIITYIFTASILRPDKIFLLYL